MLPHTTLAQGVRLGVDCELPRVSALYTAKQQWRCYDHIHEEAEMRDNYIFLPETSQTARGVDMWCEAS